jgi:GNAT superfamily N-acetyltransferase
MTADLFRTPRLRVVPVGPGDLGPTLGVYRQCEDFLALGPQPKASAEMVLADLAHSRQVGGVYCGLWDARGLQIGVLDYIPLPGTDTAALELLVVARPHRGRGYGTEVLTALEEHLTRTCGTLTLESGVQVNNPTALRFWRARGFQIGTVRRAMPDGTTTYAMSKQLG